MLEISTHPWIWFALPSKGFDVFGKRWFLMSPGRIVRSPVRVMGFPPRLEESPSRLWIRVIEVSRPSLKELLLRSRRRLNHNSFYGLRCNLGCIPKWWLWCWRAVGGLDEANRVLDFGGIFLVESITKALFLKVDLYGQDLIKALLPFNQPKNSFFLCQNFLLK